MRKFDYCERRGIVKGTVVRLLNLKRRQVPIALVSFRHPLHWRNEQKLFLAVDGLSSGQTIYAGRRSFIGVGNVLPISNLVTGLPICCIENRFNDSGKFVRCAGTNGTIICHYKKFNLTKVRLPSNITFKISSDCRAIVGQVACGGNHDTYRLKSVVNFYLKQSRGIRWPSVRGIAMNPVDHCHGGGNHQHLGHSSTVGRRKSPGRKVGLVAARHCGRRTR